jgi:hypothetical protein
MADSGVPCTTPINIPLETSLYVGNMLSGILFGETGSLANQRNRILRKRLEQDWIFSHSWPLCIVSPIVPLNTAKAKHFT